MVNEYQSIINVLESQLEDVECQIDDLESRREELRGAINCIGKLADEMAPPRPAEFDNMTYLEGALSILRQSHKALSTAEITKKLQEGGKGASAKNAYQTVYRTLKHEYGKKQRQIGKRGSKWYVMPGIRFVPAPVDQDDAAAP